MHPPEHAVKHIPPVGDLTPVRNRSTVSHMRNPITRENWRDEAYEQGISLVELAKRTGISTRAIYSYSSGQHKPSDAWVVRVGIVLNAIAEARVA